MCVTCQVARMNLSMIFSEFCFLKLFLIIVIIVVIIDFPCDAESVEIFGSFNGFNDKHKKANQTLRRINSREMIGNSSSKEISFDPKISHPFTNSNSEARVPTIVFNQQNLARRVSLNTLILSSLLYSLTILPALFTVTGYDPFGGKNFTTDYN